MMFGVGGLTEGRDTEYVCIVDFQAFYLPHMSSLPMKLEHLWSGLTIISILANSMYFLMIHPFMPL
jgi:hypothetical protein